MISKIKSKWKQKKKNRYRLYNLKLEPKKQKNDIEPKKYLITVFQYINIISNGISITVLFKTEIEKKLKSGIEIYFLVSNPVLYLFVFSYVHLKDRKRFFFSTDKKFYYKYSDITYGKTY